jgi:single-strand DNA-binding protein
MYNKVILIGNLTRDIELRYIPSGAAIGKSAIATSHKFKAQDGSIKEEICFLDFNVFGKPAETINQYCKKGSKVMLEGRLVLESWTAQDGTSRSKHSLRVETFKFLDVQQKVQEQQMQPMNYQKSNNGTGGQTHQEYANQQPSMDDNIPVINVDVDGDEIQF